MSLSLADRMMIEAGFPPLSEMKKKAKQTKEDGGPGSGNHGHGGVPGQRGGSAPGNGSRNVVNGADLSQTYKGKPDLKSVLKAQGYDGLPKVVSKQEFDDAVKASGVVCQRVYSASSPEILDAYRNSLYNGDFYVECSGGTRHGSGMYCVSNYEGQITDQMQKSLEYYQARGERDAIDTLEMHERYTNKKAEIGKTNPAETKLPFVEFAKKYLGSKVASYTETMTLDPSAKIISSDKARSLELNKSFSWEVTDVGARAALCGYDAIRVDESGYTVVLNRTKLIIQDGSDHKDAADSSSIHFQQGKDGVIYAIRSGEVIGCIFVSGDAENISEDAEKEIDKADECDTINSQGRSDGGPGSGNFGHAGMPGHIGGSAPSSLQKALHEALSTGKLSKKIDDDKQKKHRVGSEAYNKETGKGLHKSLVTVSNQEVRRIVSRYAGKGNVMTRGTSFRETFTHDKIIGFYVDASGETVLPTKRGTIHYSATGAHIVPARP